MYLRYGKTNVKIQTGLYNFEDTVRKLRKFTLDLISGKFRETDSYNTDNTESRSKLFSRNIFQMSVNFTFFHIVRRPPFLERTSRRQLSASKSSPSSHVTKPDCSPKSFGLLQSIDAYFLLSSLFLALATSIK